MIKKKLRRKCAILLIENGVSPLDDNKIIEDGIVTADEFEKAKKVSLENRLEVAHLLRKNKAGSGNNANVKLREAILTCDLENTKKILRDYGNKALICSPNSQDREFNPKTLLEDLVSYDNKNFVAILFLITKSFSKSCDVKFSEVEESYKACKTLSDFVKVRNDFVDVIDSIYSQRIVILLQF